MTNTTRFAARVYKGAAIYGLIALLPMYFSVERIATEFPPALTHVEFFFGFVGLAVVWQLAFLLIARDPQRYRALMPITMLEKASFFVPCVVMLAMGTIAPLLALGGIIDGVLGVLFAIAYFKTPVSS